jgi:hypothetical protein
LDSPYEYFFFFCFFLFFNIYAKDKKKMVIVTIPLAKIKQLQTMRPTTHEIGGSFELDASSRVTRIHTMQGERCRDPDGRLLSGKICQVQNPTGDVVFHTHPFANRPSSTDLKISIVSTHKANVVVAPYGIWIYAPKSDLRQRYNNMSEEERRCLVQEFRWLGHRQQENTQRDNCDGMLDWMHDLGFTVRYFSYTEDCGQDISFP